MLDILQRHIPYLPRIDATWSVDAIVITLCLIYNLVKVYKNLYRPFQICLEMFKVSVKIHVTQARSMSNMTKIHQHRSIGY